VERLEDEGARGEGWALLERLEPHLFEDGPTLGGERASRELSRYGFGYKVTTGTHDELLTDLWIACMEDAYDYARERVDQGQALDWTGELSPIEVDAADHQVSLPYNYWQRRDRTFELELGAELEPLIAAAKAEDE
jgi:hypothetical protein